MCTAVHRPDQVLGDTCGPVNRCRHSISLRPILLPGSHSGATQIQQRGPSIVLLPAPPRTAMGHSCLSGNIFPPPVHLGSVSPWICCISHQPAVRVGVVLTASLTSLPSENHRPSVWLNSTSHFHPKSNKTNLEVYPWFASHLTQPAIALRQRRHLMWHRTTAASPLLAPPPAPDLKCTGFPPRERRLARCHPSIALGSSRMSDEHYHGTTCRFLCALSGRTRWVIARDTSASPCSSMYKLTIGTSPVPRPCLFVHVLDQRLHCKTISPRRRVLQSKVGG